MNAKITANMRELELHDLEQVAGGGKFNPNKILFALSPAYAIGYTIGYFGS
ncbi:hypothetical protein [Neisseria dentiae]|uniref:hypothetical protein n=1 Tax=Neisseria dentiae TaxID=194197 RepID=UPI000DFB81EB|nr:hypothetical protein [Neisseria dentiae]QMT45353.1 hypothetical protein H3L92_00385 [Neisseria dentiae]STZ51125.1 Uncharacterised protein [Neisseria dentiae]